MSIQLGGAFLADPDAPLQRRPIFIGQQDESADGTLLTDCVGLKWSWHLKWSGVTRDEYDDIAARLVAGTQELILPYDTTPYYVEVKFDSIDTDYSTDGVNTIHRIEFDVEEVAVA